MTPTPDPHRLNAALASHEALVENLRTAPLLYERRDITVARLHAEDRMTVDEIASLINPINQRAGLSPLSSDGVYKAIARGRGHLGLDPRPGHARRRRRLIEKP